MKKLITITLILIGISVNAQEEKDNYFSISTGFDIRNGFVGSKPTNNEQSLNWTAEAHVSTENIDFGLGYEAFERLNYDRKFMAVGYHIPVCYINGTDIKFTIITSLEFSWIGREWNNNGPEKRTFFTPSFNTNFNWDLNKTFAVQFCVNLLPRPDIRVVYNEENTKIILNNSLKLVIKIPHN